VISGVIKGARAEISFLPGRRCLSTLELTARETREGLKLVFRAKLRMRLAALNSHGITANVAFRRGEMTAVLRLIEFFSGDTSPAAIGHFHSAFQDGVAGQMD
jgi:hypothetical protein